MTKTQCVYKGFALSCESINIEGRKHNILLHDNEFHSSGERGSIDLTTWLPSCDHAKCP
jgi:hypothetical protein